MERSRNRTWPFAAFAAAFCAALGGGALAQTDLSLSVSLGDDGAVRSASYKCSDGTDLVVRYVDAGPNALALIPLKGDVVVFVGVIAASGARYVAGASEWWVKGTEARLGDDRNGGPDAIACAEERAD